MNNIHLVSYFHTTIHDDHGILAGTVLADRSLYMQLNLYIY